MINFVSSTELRLAIFLDGDYILTMIFPWCHYIPGRGRIGSYGNGFLKRMGKYAFGYKKYKIKICPIRYCKLGINDIYIYIYKGNTVDIKRAKRSV